MRKFKGLLVLQKHVLYALHSAQIPTGFDLHTTRNLVKVAEYFLVNTWLVMLVWSVPLGHLWPIDTMVTLVSYQAL